MKLSKRTVKAFFPEARLDSGRRREVRINCLRLHRDRKTGRLQRDTKKHLYLNFEKGLFHCFACRFSGTLDFFARLLGTQAEGSALGLPFLPARRLKQKAFQLPDSYRPLKKNMRSRIGRRALEYVLGRRVTWEQIKAHKIGFASRGIAADAVILPVIEKGELLYWQARYFRKGKRRYHFPTGSREGILFNWDRAILFDRIVLVEGIFDALAVGDCALGLLSKELLPSVLRRLRKLKRKTFIIMLDGGEIQDALAIAKQMWESGLSVRVAELPEETDPGILSRRELDFYAASSTEIDLGSLLKLYSSRSPRGPG